jgi:hypothetical protein
LKKFSMSRKATTHTIKKNSYNSDHCHTELLVIAEVYTYFANHFLYS